MGLLNTYIETEAAELLEEDLYEDMVYDPDGAATAFTGAFVKRVGDVVEDAEPGIEKRMRASLIITAGAITLISGKLVRRERDSTLWMIHDPGEPQFGMQEVELRDMKRISLGRL